MNTSRKEEDVQGVVSIIDPTIVEAQAMVGDRRSEVSGVGGVRVAAVVRHGGQRAMIVLTDDDDEPVLTLSVTGAQAWAPTLVLTDTGSSAIQRATADIRRSGQRSARRLGPRSEGRK